MSLVMRRALCVVKCVGVWVVMCLDKRCCYVYAYVNLFMDQFISQTHTNILYSCCTQSSHFALQYHPKFVSVFLLPSCNEKDTLQGTLQQTCVLFEVCYSGVHTSNSFRIHIC